MKRQLLLVLLPLTLLTACKSGKKTASSSQPTDKTVKEKPSKTDAANNKKADAVIKEARTYTGTKYKYGGTTRAGIDCSGLTCASFKAAEIILPRTAGDQAAFGKTVELSKIKKGDLVFFTDKKGNTKITHVGIISEVKNDGTARFIHASTKLGVVEVDLFSTYYKPLILKAVRVL